MTVDISNVNIQYSVIVSAFLCRVYSEFCLAVLSNDLEGRISPKTKKMVCKRNAGIVIALIMILRSD